jgi:iron complex outermembrane receptor protein
LKKLNTIQLCCKQGLFSAILFLFSFSLTAQVSGTILDPINDEPLIGVNVSLKSNSAIGTITDIDGSFSVNASIGDTLTVSYVGYQTTDYPVNSNNLGVLKLQEASELLNEVVVVGYGAVDKKDLTGVVSKVNEEDFVQGAISSPEKLLNGKVAGLQISSNGEPGGGTRLRLRGGTSLDASSDPLIVVDGVPLDSRGFASSRNPLNFINANDIASMTVLKDASASAIYGSRGANGVIIITTKSGNSAKPKLAYSGNANVNIFTGSPNHLSTQNFRNAISAKAPQEIEFLGEADTDWVSEVTQLSTSTEHNLSLSGGDKSFNYHLSGGYLNSKGVLISSAHEKKTISGNVTKKLLDDNLSISFKTRTGITDDVFAPNVIGAALAFDPTRPVLDENSMYGGFFQWDDPLATGNPVSILELNDNRGQLVRSLNNLTVSYNLPFLEGLSVTSNTSYDNITGDRRDQTSPFEKSNFDRGGRLFLEELRNYSALIETYGTYKTDLSPSAKLEFTAGHSWQEFDQQNRWEFGNGLEMDESGEYAFTTDIAQDSFLVTNRLISFFGRANLSLNDKYLLTGSLRRDGSSRFGATNRWGLFPAAAFAWRILEEDFATGLADKFSSLKLRVSWGVTGNEDINDFLFTTFYSFGTDDARYQFGEEFVRTLRGTGVDPDIKWEETTSFNVGVDFGFLNNRLSGSLDLYRKYTDDLLFTVATPAFTNLNDRVLTNIGEMENRGIELSIDGVVLDGKNLDWNLGFNLAANQNEIQKLDNSLLRNAVYETGGISGDIGQTIQLLQVGESIETFRTFRHRIGVNGDGFADDLDIYEDINGDGLINENDLVVGESAAPKLILGLSSNIKYKNWDLSAVVRSHLGNHVYNNVASGTGFFDRLTDRVTNNVDESAFVVNFKERQLRSDYYVEGASFLKLDNVSLGYSLNATKVFSSLRFYVTGTNLLTITNYSGLDPELPQFTGGIDNNLYPISSNFLIGLNAQF